MTETPIPSDDELRALLDGALGEEERLRIEVLLEGNDDGLRRFEAITGFGDFRQDFLEANPSPTPVRSEVLVGLIGKLKAGDFSRPTADEEALGILDTPPAGDEPGRLGNYEVLDVIACGGMGIVFRARDPDLDRLVAIKSLAPRFAKDNEARERFLSEAQVVAALDHPNILPIHTVAEGHHVPYFVMRLVEGETLDAMVAREGSLPQKRALRIGLQIARALGAAHAANVIHRDLKPANILIEGARDRVWVADFGIAKRDDGDKGEAAGTPAFSAPEQLAGAAPSVASDLFALGATLEFVGGSLRKPFDALIAADPAARPASAEIVVQQLERALRPTIRRRFTFAAVGLVVAATLFAALSPRGLSGSLNHLFGSGDFYVAGRLGTHPTLEASIANSRTGDILLVDFDGQRTLPPTVVTRPLTIRAAHNTQPTFVQSRTGSEMLRLESATTLDGLTFVRPPASQPPKPMIFAKGGALTLNRCNIIGLKSGPRASNAPIFTDGLPALDIRDCTILTGDIRWLNSRARMQQNNTQRGSIRITNSLIVAATGPHLAFENIEVDVILKNVTALGSDLFFLSGSSGKSVFDVQDSVLLAERCVVSEHDTSTFQWGGTRNTLSAAAGGFSLRKDGSLVTADELTNVEREAPTEIDFAAQWIVADSVHDWADWLESKRAMFDSLAGNGAKLSRLKKITE